MDIMLLVATGYTNKAITNPLPNFRRVTLYPFILYDIGYIKYLSPIS